MKVGQIIYEINKNGEQNPYIVYGVYDNYVNVEKNIVFAISIHKQTNCGINCERIKIPMIKIDNLCFNIEDANTDIDGTDAYAITEHLNKNEKHIIKYFKKNGF